MDLTQKSETTVAHSLWAILDALKWMMSDNDKRELAEMAQNLITELNQVPQPPVSMKETPGSPSFTDPLTPREREILHLIADGFSNQEIADRLYVGVSTVKKHINHIYDKLGVKNRTQAVSSK